MGPCRGFRKEVKDGSLNGSDVLLVRSLQHNSLRVVLRNFEWMFWSPPHKQKIGVPENIRFNLHTALSNCFVVNVRGVVNLRGVLGRARSLPLITLTPFNVFN